MPASGVKSKAQLKCIYTLLTLKCVSITGTHLHTYRDKPGSPMVIKAKRETEENYLKGMMNVPPGRQYSQQLS